jgi:transposase
MAERFPPILESQEELEALLKANRDVQVQRRVHLLLLIRTGAVKTRVQAARHFRVHRNSIRNWLKIYEKEGIEQLLRIEQGAPPAEQKTLPDNVYQALKARLGENGFPDGYIQAQRWLEEAFGLNVSYKTVHGILRYRLKAKLKRARPSHVKKTKPTSPPSPSA